MTRLAVNLFGRTALDRSYRRSLVVGLAVAVLWIGVAVLLPTGAAIAVILLTVLVPAVIGLVIANRRANEEADRLPSDR